MRWRDPFELPHSGPVPEAMCRRWIRGFICWQRAAGSATLNLRQIIREVTKNVDDCVSQCFAQGLEPPTSVLVAGTGDSLESLGYHSRNLTRPKGGVLRISVRRFRCWRCGKTVSILPSFAQPYRLVLDATINEFFDGTLSANALSLRPLLKQYWNRFANWLPRIDPVMRSMVARSPSHTDADGWWQVMAAEFKP